MLRRNDKFLQMQQKDYIQINFFRLCMENTPVNINLFSCLTKNGKIVTEESTSDFGIGSEICFELFKSNRQIY